MKTITENDKVTIHGFENWRTTVEEWDDIMNTVLIGASQDCDATINGITKTLKEWQNTKESK